MKRNARLVSDNTLKLGLFGANCSSGRTYSQIPERWNPSWENMVALARMADEVGMECMVPLACWKGYGGETNPNGTSFEATTWACGLLAATRHINVFTTIHVPLTHPLLAAKQMVTVDHIGQGRLGVNVVCGWNEDEFRMLGVQKKEHDDRYAEGDEWWSIIKRAWSREEPFDFNDTYFQLGKVESSPAPYTGGVPMMMNAGSSAAGRDFAIRNADLHFDGVETPEESQERILDTKRRARGLGRTVQVWTSMGIVCRPTKR